MIFENIFQAEKETKRQASKPEEQITIIADYREKNSLVISELIARNIKVDFQNLPVADFLVKDTAIERKTVSDFLSSMINKRLSKQLGELQQYPKRLLLIEGIEERELYKKDEDYHKDNAEGKGGINPNAIRGFLLSILLEYQVPIVFTKDSEDTAQFIQVLAKKQANPNASMRAVKKSLSSKEKLVYLMEGFPNIGPATAKKLLSHFKTLKNIINASEEELKSIIGKKAEIITLLRNISY